MELYQLRKMYGHCSLGEILEVYKTISLDAVDEFDENNTPLHLACKYADVEAVGILLKRGMLSGVVNKYARLPLHMLARLEGERDIAIAGGKVRACADLLFAAKASATRRDDNGLTPSLEAAALGRHELLESAITHDVRLTATDSRGNTALHLVCKQVGSVLEMLQWAEDAVEKITDSYTEDRKEQLYAERDKCKKRANDYFLSAKVLLEGGLDADEKNNSGETALDIAVESNAKEIAALLNGYSLEENSSNIYKAIESRDYEALTALCQTGDTINGVCDDEGEFTGMTPLAMACYLLDRRLVEILLSHGAIPGHKDSGGRTAIARWFAYRGDAYFDYTKAEQKEPERILQLLLDKGLDVDGFINDKSDTAVLAACREADRGTGYNGTRMCYALAEYLIQSGADVNISNIDGITPLMVISMKDDADTRNLQIMLLEAGARVDAIDKDGNTALHYAASNRNAGIGKEMTEMLFDFGCTDTGIVNNAGKTALEIAAEHNNEALVKLLFMNS